MTQFQVGVGRPIYNVQEFLRVIAQSNENLPQIVPDGIFGVETQRAVRSFQEEYNLPGTGEIDNDTWDKIIEIYAETKIYTTPVMTSLFPSPDHVIREGDRADFHYPIHAMIFALSKRFDNIDGFDEISDLYQGGVVNTTRQLQALMGLDCNGELDIKCWRALSRLYENVIAKETFDIGMGAPQLPTTPSAPIRDNEDARLGERFVPREEFDEDMRRETGETGDNMLRNGIITPILDINTTETQQNATVDDMPAPMTTTPASPITAQQNMNRDIRSENLRDNTEAQIQSDRRENMDNAAARNDASVQRTTENGQFTSQNNQNTATREKPKMPPLRWNFR